MTESGARWLLWPASRLYLALAKSRVSLYESGWIPQRKLGKPVISVGNLSVGGTGKTPMVMWLAERFLVEGKRIGILSRGYKGTDGTSDEIELMKARLGEGVLFGVGPDRYEEGRRLEAQGVDMFLLDDGFQHLPLARDVDIVLVDRSQPPSSNEVLPMGRLREPRSALRRADIVVFTRMGSEAAKTGGGDFSCSTELLGWRLLGGTGTLSGPGELRGRRAFGFCGIGNPRGFWRDLERWGIDLVGRRAFADHHRYSGAEAEEIEDDAVRLGADAIVMTEKDVENLSGAIFRRLPGYAAVITLDVHDEKRFLAEIRSRLNARPGVDA